MAKNTDILLYGGIAVVGVIVFITMLAAKNCAKESAFDEIVCSINSIFTGGLSPADEEAQAAMYGGYY